MKQKFKVTLKSLDEIVKSHKLINICQDGTLVFNELHIPNRFLKLLEKEFELEEWDDNEEEFFNYKKDLLIPKSFCKSIESIIDWNDISKDTKVWVRDSDFQKWELRYFADYLPTSYEYKFVTYCDGYQKKFAEGVASWKQCILHQRGVDPNENND